MIFRPLLGIAALCALLVLPASAQTQRQWLAEGPIPTRYEIAITPDVEAGTFAGEARISVEAEQSAPTVTMNALGLEISRATIDGAAAAVSLNEDAQTLTLTPRRALRAGRHTVRFVYTGKIQDDAYGLFRVSYEANGEAKRALATQFEPADARRLAPVWDQPNRRAVFSLTVTAPSDQMAVSNMPVAQATRMRGGLTRTRFADTPSMASYLLFLAVGDFERVTRDVDGVELGVVMRRGEGHRAQTALDAGEQSLRFYTEYFGVRFPLPKLDMIGVPGAGGFGAMENWGAILYFDQFLLVDEHSSEGERQRVFAIIAHEIAHQWFGDLVTMAWWDDLWLNEGFASWMAAKATEHVHPDWQPWLSVLTNSTAGAMALDARVGTHPIVQTVNTIDEANLAFDTITYQKGLSVIRMIEAYLGEENFRNGVRAYINAHAYGNARTEDLWAALQAASGQPVLDIARSFTTQPGFPVLTASDGPAGSAAILLSQRRFATDAASRTDELWTTPVVARRVGAAPVRAVIAAEADGRIDTPPCCGPYLVNAGQSGFFRVLYDEHNFAGLNSAFPQLDDADQLGLLLDYYAFGRTGDAPFTNYLDLASTLQPDANPVIAADTVGSMLALAAFAEERPSRDSVRDYARNAVQPFFARLGWDKRDGEPVNDTLLRAQLITALSDLGDSQIIAEAARRAADPSTLEASIRAAVIGAYAANADAAAYADLLAQARAATDFVEQRRLWQALASAKDPALAQETLRMALTDEVTRQLRPQIIAGVANAHPRLAWDFLVAHRSEIEAMLDPLQRLEYPANLAQVSSDPAMATELEAYARDFPEGALPTIASAAASIRLRAETIAERMPAVEAWIAARNAPPARPRRRRPS